ncbi:hypothetical protein SAMN04489762_3469 [Terribacillus saccharophilus]|uniref:DUF4145 domain-containing protein n=1 Tax=Terribacillus saccharophilus TaxID=361277 RepID=A0AAX2EJV6_9BACI|nr:hypothetical protein SAMN04489762_3469 [Terribacillus saccharophilus]
MNKLETLRQFLKENIDDFEPSSSIGTSFSNPDFNLLPRDFMSFAKTELEKMKASENNLIHILNCLSHLKRAIDCQIDVFLHQLNLYNIIRKKNLKIDKKLEFLKNIGIIESSSISRLNAIRNKMEHHYKIPDIIEIEVYYDLVNAVVSLIESNIFIFLYNCEVQIELMNGYYKWFNLEYRFNQPGMVFKVSHEDKNRDFSITVNVSEQLEFAYYIKTLLILGRLGFQNNDVIREELFL